jgi:hypothetical protein
VSLKDRCNQFLQSRERGMLPDPDDLAAFVLTEIGRSAHERFDSATPLALFFHNVADREEFVDAITAAKPGMISKRWPR